MISGSCIATWTIVPHPNPLWHKFWGASPLAVSEWFLTSLLWPPRAVGTNWCTCSDMVMTPLELLLQCKKKVFFNLRWKGQGSLKGKGSFRDKNWKCIVIALGSHSDVQGGPERGPRGPPTIQWALRTRRYAKVTSFLLTTQGLVLFVNSKKGVCLGQQCFYGKIFSFV